MVKKPEERMKVPANPFRQLIDDGYFEKAYLRFQAFMQGEVADRPPVNITFRENRRPLPQKSWATSREKWLDVDFRAEYANAVFDNTVYYSDALPTAFPNLGPEIFTACCGAPYHFRPETTWTDPVMTDAEWDEPGKYRIDRSSEYFKLLERYTRSLIALAKDRFAVGMTDIHIGADHLAALRDPQIFCMDLYDYPEQVKEALRLHYEDYFKFYDYFYDMIHASGQPASGWINYISFGRYNATQCDFSCLISRDMFMEFFYDRLVEEHARLDESIYHLDGPGALKYLDDLMEIKRLNAIQWVCGAGNEGFDRWIPVYKRIQAGHKGIFLGADIKELDSIITNLKPDGIWFPYISGIDSRETADFVLKRITNWK